MAWNEQGGGSGGGGSGAGGGRDPWQQGRGGNQGPPDLDEAFKKLQERLAKLFNGGSGGGRRSGGKGELSAGLLFLIALGAAVIYLLVGVYMVDEKERAVVLRFGKALDGTVLPGLHWNPPIIDRVLIENVSTVRSRPHDAEMLTKDENIAKVQMTVQYVISDIRAYKLNVRDPDETLHQAMESALRHVVGSTDLLAVITKGRATLGAAVHERLQDYMDNYGAGIEVTEVNINRTGPPDPVQAAFDDVVKAREDEVRLRNEADAYANQLVPEARGEAQRLLEQAQAYKERVVARSKGEAERFNKLYAEYRRAPAVTRSRMYIDTLEQVMSKSTKVMIDVEEGNNILYLPLDKIISERQQQEDQEKAGADAKKAPDYSSGAAGRRARERRQ